jgi:hypothetical protein
MKLKSRDTIGLQQGVKNGSVTCTVVRTVRVTAIGMGIHTISAYSYYWPILLLTMKTKKILLYPFIILNLSSCTAIYYSNWRSSTYDPSQHTFHIDSASRAKYGKEIVEQRIRLGIDEWIVDSIPYFYFNMEKKSKTIPIIPIFYRINFQKKNALYRLDASINNKIYQSFDSASYTIYDSLKIVYHKGSYKCNRDITTSKRSELLITPYTINIRLEKTDVVYGDIDLFFTDYNNRPVMHTIRRIRFKYEKGRYWTADINS